MLWPLRTLPAIPSPFSGAKKNLSAPAITMFHGFYIIHLIFPKKKAILMLKSRAHYGHGYFNAIQIEIKVPHHVPASENLLINVCQSFSDLSLDSRRSIVFQHASCWLVARTRAYKLMSSVSSHRYGSFKAPFHVWMICNKHETARLACCCLTFAAIKCWLAGGKSLSRPEHIPRIAFRAFLCAQRCRWRQSRVTTCVNRKLLTSFSCTNRRIDWLPRMFDNVPTGEVDVEICQQIRLKLHGILTFGKCVRWGIWRLLTRCAWTLLRLLSWFDTFPRQRIKQLFALKLRRVQSVNWKIINFRLIQFSLPRARVELKKPRTRRRWTEKSSLNF